MGVGHIAVALGASKAAPRVNVGWLMMAALLSDFLLGVFAALGIEHATVPTNYAVRRYLLFTFPYSHGVRPAAVGGVIWTARVTPLFARLAKSLVRCGSCHGISLFP